MNLSKGFVRWNFPLLIVIFPLCSAAEPLQLHGFITVGATMSDSDTPFMATARIDDDLRFTPDSIVGLQIDRVLNPSLNVSTQITAKNSDDNYKVNAEWLYVSLHLDSATMLRTGRIRLPAFNYSSTLLIGNSYPWSRPPAEIYDLVEGVTGIVGMDLTHRFRVLDRILILNLYFGEMDDGISLYGQDIQITSDELWGGSILHETESTSYRIAYAKYSADFSISGARVEMLNGEFLSAGVTHEWGVLEFDSEWARRNLDLALLGDQYGWYGSISYLGHTYRPFLKVALQDSKNADVRNLQDSVSYSMGINRPIAEVFTLKAEVLYSDAKHGTRGLFVEIPDPGDTDVVIYNFSLTGTF